MLRKKARGATNFTAIQSLKKYNRIEVWMGTYLIGLRAKLGNTGQKHRIVGMEMIKDITTGKTTYKSSLITNLQINNVEQIVECARTRWKIENEHNNVLKNRGYNLKHNFGHGKEHAS
ncbi:MAG: hypothetical protein Ta2F_13150 [Termitinemataceae bacterium]|nr:MAG: hypothetical protein Ta2F_13150 [Termitinemataceae bacterium]